MPLFQGGDEDCLFLDVYVPGKAIRNPKLKLSVLVWIYGGAYLFGSKDTLQPHLPFYDGSGMMAKANNDMIFVAMNYRLGSYGWLAGTTMESEGTPNAGLWDQRAAFQWVRDYIHLLGGDPARVTAMGESAGAGSIIHHLVGNGGKLDPLFSKAIVQSPAYQPLWDRGGIVQHTFDKFASLAGCRGKGLACLRGADAATLAKANKQLIAQQAPGTMAIGPTPDGSFIRQLPVLELQTGNYWKGVESMILSHTADESSLFVSGAVQTDAEFSGFLDTVFPNYTRTEGLNAKIEAFYPPVSGKKSKYATQTARVTAFLRESCFTCNVRCKLALFRLPPSLKLVVSYCSNLACVCFCQFPLLVPFRRIPLSSSPYCRVMLSASQVTWHGVALWHSETCLSRRSLFTYRPSSLHKKRGMSHKPSSPPLSRSPC